MLNVRRGSLPRIRTSHVVAGAALVLITTGGASAAGLITGKDIKDGSVSTKDVKNGSLLLKDFKASERSKLVGPAGANGTNGTNGTNGANGAPGAPGAPGASAFTPPPAGTVIKGGGVLNANISAGGIAIRDYAPLPFTTTTPLKIAAPRNLWLGAHPFAGDVRLGETNTTACGGTAAAPSPAPGTMCVYLTETGNINDVALFDGVDVGVDGGDNNGFYVWGNSDAAGTMLVRYVWAYKAS